MSQLKTLKTEIKHKVFVLFYLLDKKIVCLFCLLNRFKKSMHSLILQLEHLISMIINVTLLNYDN